MPHPDLDLANLYIKKAQHAKDKGIAFEISFLSFKNMMTAKRCYYTGIKLNHRDHSIDRINNKLGYVSGNVVSCHVAFNKFKGVIENPQNPFTKTIILKAMSKWCKEKD